MTAERWRQIEQLCHSALKLESGQRAAFLAEACGADGELRHEVETLLASKALVVDACRHAVRDASTVVSLATRPVLFALARALGEAWPGDVAREVLIARAFRGKHADDGLGTATKRQRPADD